MDTLDKGMICGFGRTEQKSVRFHHRIQNGEQFKSHELFIPRIFHLILLKYSWPQVSENMESKTANKGNKCIEEKMLNGYLWMVRFWLRFFFSFSNIQVMTTENFHFLNSYENSFVEKNGLINSMLKKKKSHVSVPWCQIGFSVKERSFSAY